jgi:hypothetical protein
MAANPTLPTASAEIPITSPVIEHLPELLDVYRLTLDIHREALATGADLPVILSGWVQADARAYLRNTLDALSAVYRTLAKGKADL